MQGSREISGEQRAALRAFVERSRFSAAGAVVTDLDGTAVHEHRGVVALPESVVRGLRDLYEAGRPIVINTLRFPLSVIRTFGREWWALSNAPVPVISLNGALLGRMVRRADDALAWEEIEARPLDAGTIARLVGVVRALAARHVEELLVFTYPRDWRKGERIWTPRAERVAHVREKYPSASEVATGEVAALEALLTGEDHGMAYVQLDVPEDTLMAYQHTRGNGFFTRPGVDKRSGAERMAELMGFSLPDSVGAGDTPMDTFLDAVGLPIHVGPLPASCQGAICLATSSQLGEALSELAARVGAAA